LRASISLWSFFRVAVISGNLRMNMDWRANSRRSTAGMPMTTDWGGRSLVMPDLAMAMAPSPMETWPTMPACPARTTPLPRVVEPAMPTWETIMHAWPVTTLWPIWTKLSIFVPAPTRVTPKRARSTHELAPISTSAPISTMPTWGILWCPVASES